MTRDVIVVPPELSMEAAWRVMSRERIRHLPVVHAGVLIGIISDRDILARSTLDENEVLRVPPDLRVGEVMTPSPLETCESSTDVADLARTMTEKKIDAMPVMNGNRLVGLVTSTDLLLLLIGREEARPLPFDFRLIEESRAA